MRNHQKRYGKMKIDIKKRLFRISGILFTFFAKQIFFWNNIYEISYRSKTIN